MLKVGLRLNVEDWNQRVCGTKRSEYKAGGTKQGQNCVCDGGADRIVIVKQSLASPRHSYSSQMIRKQESRDIKVSVKDSTTKTAVTSPMARHQDRLVLFHIDYPRPIR